MAAALKEVDCVIACGGITWARTEAEYQAVNAIGTQRLVTASVAAGVKRFVYISSLAAQGPSPDGKPVPAGADAPHLGLRTLQARRRDAGACRKGRHVGGDPAAADHLWPAR